MMLEDFDPRIGDRDHSCGLRLVWLGCFTCEALKKAKGDELMLVPSCAMMSMLVSVAALDPMEGI